MSELTLEAVSTLSSIAPAQWEDLRSNDYPFLRHDFLLGLETTGCTTAESGWRPNHLVVRSGDTLVAAAPAYLKSHSYGEYVFDWAWADAWRRIGLDYYPKLVTAIPFTPATGPRVMHTQELGAAETWSVLLQGVQALAQQRRLSSWHILFPEPDVAELLASLGLHTRHAVQFHWFNRNYRDFDDFLATFSSRKRKALRRERRRVAEQGITLRTLTGDEISPADWQTFHRFYQLTYAKRSGHGGYLTREFFTRTAAGLGAQVVMVLAEQSGRDIAGALYFRSGDTLFGRYWGCVEELDCLHFEACYYRGIEYCIEQGLQRFDPGAQGEHKIQRGFEPTRTLSSHWIAHPELSRAVGDFTREEQAHVENYRREAATLLPFRADGEPSQADT
ncbi:MAG: GNAT family N-acetyltransferase [Chromatocurvus sp.]